MIIKFFFNLFIILFLSLKAFSLELTLTQGTVKPTPIAVSDLFSQVSSLEKIGKNISSVFLITSKDQVYLFQLIKKLLFNPLSHCQANLDLKIGK